MNGIRRCVCAAVLGLTFAACTPERSDIIQASASGSSQPTAAVSLPKTIASALPPPLDPNVLPESVRGILEDGVADRFVSKTSHLIRVLSKGSGDLSPIAYTIADRTKQSVEMTFDVTVGQVKAKEPTASSVPAMVFTLDLEASNREPKGDRRVLAKVRKVSLHPKGKEEEQIAATLRTHLKPLTHAILSYSMAKNGFRQDIKFPAAANASPPAQQVLATADPGFDFLTPLLPQEPIGLGATWEATWRATGGGIDLVKRATYTLNQREGTRCSIDVALTQIAAARPVVIPGLPPGVSMNLESFHSTGSGALELDTRSLAVTRGKLTVTSTMTLVMARTTDARITNNAGEATDVIPVESRIIVKYGVP